MQVIKSINAVESVANQTGKSTSLKESVASFFGISVSTLDKLLGQGSSQFGTKGTGKVQQTGLLTTKLVGRVVANSEIVLKIMLERWNRDNLRFCAKK